MKSNYVPPEIIHEIRENGSLKIYRRSVTPGKVQQQFRDVVDVNRIMKRYTSGGGITHLNKAQPMFGDFSNVSDYSTALTAINNAQQSFQNLPSSLRSRFENNPQNLIRFLQDEKNRDEAIQLGLLKKPIQNANDDSTTNANTKASKTKTPVPPKNEPTE